MTLSVVNADFLCRIEWAEGVSPRWDIWNFIEAEDIEEGDIILFEDVDLELALTVTKFSPFTELRSHAFHHWEIQTIEHEDSVAELKADAGI